MNYLHLHMQRVLINSYNYIFNMQSVLIFIMKAYYALRVIQVNSVMIEWKFIQI